MKRGGWTVLTNHGRVLAFMAKNPERTTEEIAREADLTLRAVQRIIVELERDGYLIKHKEGRRNRYSVVPEMPMRHRLEREYLVGEILAALGYTPKKEEESVRKRQDQHRASEDPLCSGRGDIRQG